MDRTGQKRKDSRSPETGLRDSGMNGGERRGLRY
jgi:hypothetical protein